MHLQRTQKSAKTAFFHFHFMFFALFLQKTPLVFSRSSLALLSVEKETLLEAINNALEKAKWRLKRKQKC